MSYSFKEIRHAAYTDGIMYSCKTFKLFFTSRVDRSGFCRPTAATSPFARNPASSCETSHFAFSVNFNISGGSPIINQFVSDEHVGLEPLEISDGFVSNRVDVYCLEENVKLLTRWEMLNCF